MKKEIDQMLAVGLIFLVDEAKWVSLIMIKNKKEAIEKRVCVEYHSLNNACVHDPFPTPVSDEVLDNVAGNEAYSFTNLFSGYHQVRIAEEDKKKTTFTTQWRSYAYHVMSFILNNESVVFSRIVNSTFRDYIHRFLEVYMDNWMVYSLLKKHSTLLRIMFDRCRQLEISLNLKNFIFAVHFGMLLGHIVYKEGVCVDPAKVAEIMNMDLPISIKWLRSTLGHTEYYKRFIHNYALITAPMEKLLGKDERFMWLEERDATLNILKEKIASVLILLYPYWNKQFHVHIDVSGITLGTVLAQMGEDLSFSMRDTMSYGSAI
eukprot:PITA_18892